MKAQERHYASKQTVICMGDSECSKTGALFFDKIVPISFSPVPSSVVALEAVHELSRKGLPSPLFRNWRGKIRYANIDSWPLMFVEVERGKRMLIPKDSNSNPELDIALANAYVNSDSECRSAVNKFMKRVGLSRIPILLPNTLLSSQSASVTDLTFMIAGLRLIDASSLEWSQILELRKDAIGMTKLRRLRLFLHDNYLGKSRDYVEDSILQLVSDYEETARRNGCQLRRDLLAVALDSESLLTFGGLGILAAIMGSPIAAGVSGLIGAAAEIGKITLTLVGKKHEFSKLKNDHSLAYLIQLREVTKKQTS